MATHERVFWANVQRQLKIILTMVPLCVFPIPLTVIVLIPSLIFRFIVLCIAKLFRSDLSHIFSGKAVLLALESVHTRPKLNLVLHFVCDGPVPLDKLRAQFEKRIVNCCDQKGDYVYRQLRQTWTQFCGFLFWRWDKEFDLDHHIRLYDYNEPELKLPTDGCTESDVRRVTGELVAKPWKEGRGPWEILVIHNFENKKAPGKTCSVVTLRIHHALADGYSILKMMLRFVDVEDAAVPKPNFAKSPFLLRIFRPLALALKLPYDAATFVLNSFDGPNSWHLVGKKLSRKYEVFYSDDIDVEKIKEIKREHGVSYNAAAYGITAGAMREMMLQMGQRLPTSLACFVPIPLPRHPGGLLVHVSGVCFRFSPQLESPSKRIKEISRNLEALKNAPTVPIAASLVMDVLALLPVWLMRLVYNKMMMTVGMTSFPGPEGTLDFMEGARVTSIIPALGHYPGNIGAVAVLVSIAGTQRIVLTVDKEIFAGFKVPSNFAQIVNKEVEALLAGP